MGHAEAEAKVPSILIEPVPCADVCSVLVEQEAVEAVDVDVDIGANPREADNSGPWLDPFECVPGYQPFVDRRKVFSNLVVHEGQDRGAAFEDPGRELFIENRSRDEDLLLRGEERLHLLLVA